MNGAFSLGSERRGRIGEFTVESAEMTETTLIVRFSKGYVVEIPRDRVQFTYRV